MAGAGNIAFLCVCTAPAQWLPAPTGRPTCACSSEGRRGASVRKQEKQEIWILLFFHHLSGFPSARLEESHRLWLLSIFNLCCYGSVFTCGSIQDFYFYFLISPDKTLIFWKNNFFFFFGGGGGEVVGKGFREANWGSACCLLADPFSGMQQGDVLQLIGSVC